MCGSTGALSCSTTPGHSPQPSASLAVLDAALEEDLHAHADPEHRAPAGQPPADDLGPVDGAQPVHAGGERAHTGHDEPVGLERRRAVAVTVTSAPTRASARSAERRLPDP